ncbi:MAG: hydrogenase maturation nickel metallochaperone HypA [Nanoarchaeota archaeon]|nr:hydrogenase maturation nickel metallochaperone HypA [Nanoarchaeota archaeon]
MHAELAADRIVDEAEKHGNVAGVNVIVGEAAPATKDGIRNSILKRKPDWEITIETKESKVRCKCGYQGRPKITGREEEFVHIECPKCGKQPKMTEGEEIVLAEVVLKDEKEDVAPGKGEDVGEEE